MEGSYPAIPDGTQRSLSNGETGALIHSQEAPALPPSPSRDSFQPQTYFEIYFRDLPSVRPTSYCTLCWTVMEKSAVTMKEHIVTHHPNVTYARFFAAPPGSPNAVVKDIWWDIMCYNYVNGEDGLPLKSQCLACLELIEPDTFAKREHFLSKHLERLLSFAKRANVTDVTFRVNCDMVLQQEYMKCAEKPPIRYAEDGRGRLFECYLCEGQAFRDVCLLKFHLVMEHGDVLATALREMENGAVATNNPAGVLSQDDSQRGAHGGALMGSNNVYTGEVAPPSYPNVWDPECKIRMNTAEMDHLLGNVMSHYSYHRTPLVMWCSLCERVTPTLGIRTHFTLTHTAKLFLEGKHASVAEDAFRRMCYEAVEKEVVQCKRKQSTARGRTTYECYLCKRTTTEQAILMEHFVMAHADVIRRNLSDLQRQVVYGTPPPNLGPAGPPQCRNDTGVPTGGPSTLTNAQGPPDPGDHTQIPDAENIPPGAPPCGPPPSAKKSVNAPVSCRHCGYPIHSATSQLRIHNVRHHPEQIFLAFKHPQVLLSDFTASCFLLFRMEENTWRRQQRRCAYCQRDFRTKDFYLSHLAYTHREILGGKLIYPPPPQEGATRQGPPPNPPIPLPMAPRPTNAPTNPGPPPLQSLPFWPAGEESLENWGGLLLDDSDPWDNMDDYLNGQDTPTDSYAHISPSLLDPLPGRDLTNFAGIVPDFQQ